MKKRIGKKIIGTWEMVYWKCTDHKNKTTHFFGKNAKGILMYDAFGNMNAQISRAKRLIFSKPSFLKGTNSEMEMAYQSYISYYGKYYEKNARELIHQVEGSLFPNWVGEEMIRYAKIKKGHLYLSAPPAKIGNKTVSFYVKWKRIN